MDVENSEHAKKQGILNVIFPGQFLLIDAKTKIFVDNALNSTHSTKQGFSVEIPISSDTMLLKVEIGGIRATKYELKGLETEEEYTMELIYSTNLGKFGKEYKMTKEGNVIINVNEPGISETAKILNNEQSKKNKSSYNHPTQDISAKRNNSKWYNQKSKLGWSIVFWPAFLYGAYKTNIVKKTTKQYIVIALINLFACLVYISYHHTRDVKIPFLESEPDYYGYMIAEYDNKTSGADLQKQIDDYKSSHGESKEHAEWSSRKSEWEAKQYTPLPPLFLFYMTVSLGYTVVFFIRKRNDL